MSKEMDSVWFPLFDASSQAGGGEHTVNSPYGRAGRDEPMQSKTSSSGGAGGKERRASDEKRFEIEHVISIYDNQCPNKFRLRLALRSVIVEDKITPCALSGPMHYVPLNSPVPRHYMILSLLRSLVG